MFDGVPIDPGYVHCSADGVPVDHGYVHCSADGVPVDPMSC